MASFCLEALSKREIPERITALGPARPMSLEHGNRGVLGLRLGDQQGQDVSVGGTLLFEGLPESIAEGGGGLSQAIEPVLLQG